MPPLRRFWIRRLGAMRLLGELKAAMQNAGGSVRSVVRSARRAHPARRRAIRKLPNRRSYLTPFGPARTWSAEKVFGLVKPSLRVGRAMGPRPRFMLKSSTKLSRFDHSSHQAPRTRRVRLRAQTLPEAELGPPSRISLLSIARATAKCGARVLVGARALRLVLRSTASASCSTPWSARREVG